MSIIILFWTLMAVVSASQTYYFYGQMPGGPPPLRAIYLASVYSVL